MNRVSGPSRLFWIWSKKIAESVAELEKLHAVLREKVPDTGTASEAYEAHTAIQRKALARQQLILELYRDENLAENYNNVTEEEREAIPASRGIAGIAFEPPAEEVTIVPEDSITRMRLVPPCPPPIHPVPSSNISTIC